jgi:hypothetical protein
LDSLDLYEYFPLQRAPPRLRIAVIHEKNGQVKYLALHNPSNNELLCCDFNKNKVVSVVIRGLEPVKSIMCSNLAQMGILIFYQEDRSNVAILDFNTSEQHTINLPARIQKLHVVEQGLWVAKGSRDASHYLITPGSPDGLLPTTMESVQALGQNGLPLDDALEQVYSREFAPNARYGHTDSPDKYATVLENCSLAGIQQNPVKVYSYMKPEGVGKKEEGNKRVKPNTLFLERTGQLAIIRPPTDGRAESHLDLLNGTTNQIWRIKMPLAILGGAM